ARPCARGVSCSSAWPWPPAAPPSSEPSGQQPGQLADLVGDDVAEEDDQTPAQRQQGGQQQGGDRVGGERGPVGVEEQPEQVLGASWLIHGGIAPSARLVRVQHTTGRGGRR